MAHWSALLTSRSPARGMAAAAGATPTPDRPPLGIHSGLPLIRCPECGVDNVVEEYIPPIGGATARIFGEDAALRRGGGGGGGCSFLTQEEYGAILRDRGLLGPAATPEQGRDRGLLDLLGPAATPEQGQGRGCYLTSAPSGFLVPVHPGMFADVEDLMHEIVALNLAIAELTANNEQDLMGLMVMKIWKVMKTDSLIRWSKDIVKGFSMFGLALLVGKVATMYVK